MLKIGCRDNLVSMYVASRKILRGRSCDLPFLSREGGERASCTHSPGTISDDFERCGAMP